MLSNNLLFIGAAANGLVTGAYFVLVGRDGLTRRLTGYFLLSSIPANSVVYGLYGWTSLKLFVSGEAAALLIGATYIARRLRRLAPTAAD